MVMTLSKGLLYFAGLALFTWVSVFGEGGGIHGMNLSLPVFLYEARLDIRGHPGGAALQVIGVHSGSYTLEIQGSDVELETSRKTFLDREISEGEIHLSLIEFDERTGEELAVTYSGSSRIQH